MLFLLLEKLNFTFRLVPDKIVGFELNNGSWTGTIGKLAFEIWVFILMEVFDLPSGGTAVSMMMTTLVVFRPVDD